MSSWRERLLLVVHIHSGAAAGGSSVRLCDDGGRLVLGLSDQAAACKLLAVWAFGLVVT
jgi:hypothetical protein